MKRLLLAALLTGYSSNALADNWFARPVEDLAYRLAEDLVTQGYGNQLGKKPVFEVTNLDPNVEISRLVSAYDAAYLRSVKSAHDSREFRKEYAGRLAELVDFYDAIGDRLGVTADDKLVVMLDDECIYSLTIEQERIAPLQVGYTTKIQEFTFVCESESK